MWTESAKMATAVQGGQDRQLKSPFLTKKGRPSSRWQIRHSERAKVIDMGEDEYDPPIILERLFLSTVKAIIYIGTGEVHMHFPSEKVRRYFLTLTIQLKTLSSSGQEEDDATQLEDANHQGWMGRLRRRSGKV